MERKIVLDDDALYLEDNGAVTCGLHAGITARLTGRDPRGQKLQRITATNVAWWIREIGCAPECETCRHIAMR